MYTLPEQAKWLWRAALKWRWLALGVGAVAAVLGSAGLQLVPTRYEATGRIAVDTQTALKPLLTGLTYQPDIDQKLRVRLLASTLISRPNVARLLQTPTLADEPTFTVYTREELIARLMRDIKITQMTTTPNLYQIAYRGQTPEVAVKVVGATLDLFGRTSAGSKQQDSKEADRFLEQQLNDYAARLTESENRLYEFKTRHFGGSGVSSQDYFARIATLNEEVDKLRVETNTAERMRDSFRRELNQPYQPLYQQMRSDLAEAEARAAALASQLSIKQSQLTRARALADRMPRLETEMAQLRREQEVARKNYEQMLARRESASLGVKVDATPQMAEFRIVEPPTVSRWPVILGPLHGAALVLLLAPMLGIAAAAVAERLRPTVHDARSLRLLGNRPVVGTVSTWRTPGAQRRERIAGAAFALALVVALALQVLWLGQTIVVPIAQRALGVA